MNFAPPKVNYKKPQVETFLLFLKTKGWNINGHKKGFFLMKPPSQLDAPEDYLYHLPGYKKLGIGSDEMMFQAVEFFADLYDIPLQNLFDLLAMSLEEIQEEVKNFPKMLEMKKEILAAVS